MSLKVDGLSLLLIVLTSVLIMASAGYGVRYLHAHETPAQRARWLLPLLVVMWLALTVLWLADHLLVLYAALDAAVLSAVVLMRLPGTPEAREASNRYLLYTLLASVTFLLGLALLYTDHGQLRLSGLRDVDLAVHAGWSWAALAAMSAGLLLKAAAFPLHGWLPPAHAHAWTPVSAVHSGLVIKAPLFMLVQLWLILAPQAALAGQIIGICGALAIVWGSVMAWRQLELKPVVAYSSVAQMGYLLLFFPLFTDADDQASQLVWQSTWLLAINHALAKSAMFMAAGNLTLGMGRSDLKGLSGVSSRLPLSLLIFGLAGVSIMGMPPSGGFAAKWLLVNAILLSGQWPWLIVLGLGTLLSAAYVFRVFRCCFVDDHEAKAAFRAPPLTLDLIALLLALAAVVLGLVADWPLRLLRMESLP